MSLKATIEFTDAASGKTTQLLTVDLWNDGTGTEEFGNYQYKVHVGEQVRPGTITHYRRAQRNGAARLITMVLDKEFPSQT